jgi:hypothetical protein
MAGKGLFKTMFKIKGPFSALFSEQGASPPTKRMDIRLGQVDAEPEPPKAEAEIKAEAGIKPKAEAKPSIFEEDILGMPGWLLGLVLLGFAYMYRKKKKEAEEKVTSKRKRSRKKRASRKKR